MASDCDAVPIAPGASRVALVTAAVAVVGDSVYEASFVVDNVGRGFYFSQQFIVHKIKNLRGHGTVPTSRNFEADPDSATAAKEWTHWLRTFNNFYQAVQKTSPSADKLILLTNYVAPRVYDYIADCDTYVKAEKALTSLYVKPRKEVFARHVLATRRQGSGESLDQFLQALKLLAKDCQFKAVSAELACDNYVRDAFINGLSSGAIRQRLLENITLNLQTAYEQARTLEMAQKHSASYTTVEPITAAVPQPQSQSGDSEFLESSDETAHLAATTGANQCFFCGLKRHPRFKCPAREALCLKCKKQGHYAKVCRSGKPVGDTSAGKTKYSAATLATVSGAVPSSLSKSLSCLKVNGLPVNALINTGSSENFVSQKIAKENNLIILPDDGHVSMADASLSSKVLGLCCVDVELQGQIYPSVKLKVLPALCSDVILGHEFLKNHSALEMDFGGARPTLKICGLAAVKLVAPALFSNLTADCRPITAKSRHYSQADKEFVKTEIGRMLQEGIIRPSQSPWRAQVLITAGHNRRKRMVIDYSQTISRFTELDAYPLLQIDETVNNVSRYKVLSTLDLKSAYHQVPIREDEKLYTAFEASGKLTQSINLLGYSIKDGEIRPDPERLQPLLSLPLPKDTASLRRMLGEQRHSSVEKEAYAIVEALRRWKHYLIGHHFKLITDQRSVTFIFDTRSSSKIKNDKIARWRIELSCYHYDIVYRPGTENIPADALSRVCGAVATEKLKQLHESLCHPGVSRMVHFIRVRNLAYSVEDVKKVTASCPICSTVKPQESTVSLRHLAPLSGDDSSSVEATRPSLPQSLESLGLSESEVRRPDARASSEPALQEVTHDVTSRESAVQELPAASGQGTTPVPLRRSERTRRAPKYFDDYAA
ncbi:uncharacterized protein [Palaemon carinicauda]|uniref:uncharacterized protein n=1 Tax=Palaemon carinicauda TaxID=392227 RepID=UPI0035B68E14